ncbi:P-loop NTPase family protein [Roseivivax sp. CAU 1753]
MAEQLPLILPARTALGRGDFFVTEANALAVAQIDKWASWPSGKLLLVGPPGSGKTHLAHVWSAESGARILPASGLTRADIPSLTRMPVCVEDADRIAGDAAAEEALFHLHNLALAEGRPLLVTASQPPSRWGLTLPDLASRMEATPVARLDKPDDVLLAGVLAKLLHDRRIMPSATVIPYLTHHMPRSFEMARHVVEALDARSLGLRRKVTRNLAIEVLNALSVDDEDGDRNGQGAEHKKPQARHP